MRFYGTAYSNKGSAYVHGPGVARGLVTTQDDVVAKEKANRYNNIDDKRKWTIRRNNLLSLRDQRWLARWRAKTGRPYVNMSVKHKILFATLFPGKPVPK